MLRRKYLFPNVIELNYQAGRRLGVNVYLIDGGNGDCCVHVLVLDSPAGPEHTILDNG